MATLVHLTLSSKQGRIRLLTRPETIFDHLSNAHGNWNCEYYSDSDLLRIIYSFEDCIPH